MQTTGTQRLDSREAHGMRIARSDLWITVGKIAWFPTLSSQNILFISECSSSSAKEFVASLRKICLIPWVVSVHPRLASTGTHRAKLHGGECDGTARASAKCKKAVGRPNSDIAAKWRSSTIGSASDGLHLSALPIQTPHRSRCCGHGCGGWPGQFVTTNQAAGSFNFFRIDANFCAYLTLGCH